MTHVSKMSFFLILAAVLVAVSSAQAKNKKWRTSVKGHFVLPKGETITAGTPFAQEGWEAKPVGRGKVSWTAPRPGKVAVRLDSGCAVTTSTTLEKGRRYFVAVSIHGWDGEGTLPCADDGP